MVIKSFKRFFGDRILLENHKMVIFYENFSINISDFKCVLMVSVLISHGMHVSFRLNQANSLE